MEKRLNHCKIAREVEFKYLPIYYINNKIYTKTKQNVKVEID